MIKMQCIFFILAFEETIDIIETKFKQGYLKMAFDRSITIL
jgi:hypothetical protein